MKSEVYIISGFLGSGKTTVIRDFLRNGLSNRNVVIIENDFGEINIDASLLKNEGYLVTDLKEGCICCSLVGDFKKAFEDVVETYHPEVVIVEPSGIGKLSDVMIACKTASLKEKTQAPKSLTIVDTHKCGLYAENFGEFFDDQIKAAQVIYLSKTDLYENEIEAAEKIVRDLNTKATIIHELPASPNELFPQEKKGKPRISVASLKVNKMPNVISKNSEHEDHHHHHTDDGFDRTTISVAKVLDETKLIELLEHLDERSQGSILRLKGFIETEQGERLIQYTRDEWQLIPGESPANEINIIGVDLPLDKLESWIEEVRYMDGL